MSHVLISAPTRSERKLGRRVNQACYYAGIVNASLKAVRGRQVTLRGVDTRLERALRSEARRRGLSVNRTILGLLEEATGLGSPTSKPSRAISFVDLDHLAGTWSVDETEAFNHNLGSARTLDTELWP